jgi:hypothetical protein
MDPSRGLNPLTARPSQVAETNPESDHYCHRSAVKVSFGRAGYASKGPHLNLYHRQSREPLAYSLGIRPT